MRRSRGCFIPKEHSPPLSKLDYRALYNKMSHLLHKTEHLRSHLCFGAIVSDYLREETLKQLFQERFHDQSHLVN